MPVAKNIEDSLRLNSINTTVTIYSAGGVVPESTKNLDGFSTTVMVKHVLKESMLECRFSLSNI